MKYCLLVEDDPDDREFFIDSLHEVSGNIGCYAVSNGEEALSVLLDLDLQPDYIFTDLNMPRMDGFEFIKRLRGMDKFKHIPVIVFSSDFNEEHIRIFKSLNVNAYYSKTGQRLLRQVLTKYFSSQQGTIL